MSEGGQVDGGELHNGGRKANVEMMGERGDGETSSRVMYTALELTG